MTTPHSLKIINDTSANKPDLSNVIQNIFDNLHRFANIDVIGSLIIKDNNMHDLFYSSKVKLSKDDNVKMILRMINEHNRASFFKVKPRKVHKKDVSKGSFKKMNLDVSLQYINAHSLLREGKNLGTFFYTKKYPHASTSLFLGLINQTCYAIINAIINSDIYTENYKGIIKAFTIALDSKNSYTYSHSENVMKISEKLASEIGVDTTDIKTIRDAARLHDLGKIGVPSVILNKKGSLTDDEFNSIMKKHATLGANIINKISSLKPLYPLILCHHERYDGRGYPNGLHGDNIPLGARVLSVADSYHAMTSKRPYRRKLSHKTALNELRNNQGKQFDPDIIEVFIQMTENKEWME